MKVYLAAMYQWMDKIKVEREKYREAEFEITSQWIDNGEEHVAIVTRHDAAQMDLDDIDRADVLVLYTLDKGTMFSSGGRMVEMGYAMAKGKKVFIVGDRENVFCEHNSIIQCRSTEDVIRMLEIERIEVVISEIEMIKSKTMRINSTVARSRLLDRINELTRG